MRFVPSTQNFWYTANDQLSGYNLPYGEVGSTTEEWNIHFAHIPFTKYLLALGNFKYWVIATKEVI